MLFAFLAVAASAAVPAPPATEARASASVSVRVLPGARVHLGPASAARMTKASVRDEVGHRRPAYLIEFE